MISGNLISVRIWIAVFKFSKRSIRSKLVVLNLIFLQKIQSLFWIESHSLPSFFYTAFGTSDSPRVVWIRCIGNCTTDQNWFTSISLQWRAFMRLPIAPSAHNLVVFFIEKNLFFVQCCISDLSDWCCLFDAIFLPEMGEKIGGFLFS